MKRANQNDGQGRTASRTLKNFHKLGRILSQRLGCRTGSCEKGVIILGSRSALDTSIIGAGTTFLYVGEVVAPAATGPLRRERLSNVEAEWLARRVERALPAGRYFFFEVSGTAAVFITTLDMAATDGWLLPAQPTNEKEHPESTAGAAEPVELSDIVGLLGDGVRVSFMHDGFALIAPSGAQTDLVMREGREMSTLGYSRYVNGARVSERSPLQSAALESLAQRVEQVLPPRDYLFAALKDADALAVIEADFIRLGSAPGAVLL